MSQTMKENMTTTAQEMFGGFVEKAGKTFLVLQAANVFGEATTIKVTLDNLAEFYATQANNLSSGIRTLAGLPGDWRPISELADLALAWFKHINVEGMRRAARRIGLTPRF